MESLEDFKGAKTRTYDKNSADFVNGAGGNAVSSLGEVYSALRTGMVDSVITSSSSGKDGKFWKFKDFTKINYAYPLQAVTINLDYWNSLDKTQQEAMLKAAAEIEKAQWEAVKLEDKDALILWLKMVWKFQKANDELKKELDVIANKMLEWIFSWCWWMKQKNFWRI